MIRLALPCLLFFALLAPAQQSALQPPAATQQINELRTDLVKMRSLLSQMQTNLSLVTTTQTPLKHQFELEIEMWALLIDHMQQRLDALQPPPPSPAPVPERLPAEDRESTDGRYHRLFENNSVRVSGLDLPPHTQAPVYQNVRDLVWIAISDGSVTFTNHDKQEIPVQFRAGDARVFARNRVNALHNDGPTPFRSVAVELKKPGMLPTECPCSTDMEKSICGCAGARHLPALWAVSIGNLTASGTTLNAGESFRGPAPRGDMLLVAITALNLLDDASPSAAPIRLASGDVVWISAGLHQFRNTGQAPAHFFTLEF